MQLIIYKSALRNISLQFATVLLVVSVVRSERRVMYAALFPIVKNSDRTHLYLVFTRGAVPVFPAHRHPWLRSTVAGPVGNRSILSVSVIRIHSLAFTVELVLMLGSGSASASGIIWNVLRRIYIVLCFLLSYTSNIWKYCNREKVERWDFKITCFTTPQQFLECR